MYRNNDTATCKVAVETHTIMLTLLTQQALAALHDIANHRRSRLDNYQISDADFISLLGKLERAGLICLKADEPSGKLLSYSLTRASGRISLLNVLEAIGEHLNCNHPTSEEFYMRYGAVAQKLGVINQLTRSFLEDIKLTDC